MPSELCPPSECKPPKKCLRMFKSPGFIFGILRYTKIFPFYEVWNCPFEFQILEFCEQRISEKIEKIFVSTKSLPEVTIVGSASATEPWSVEFAIIDNKLTLRGNKNYGE